MSFGGHINDMVNRIKQNTALKNARRNKFKGGNDYSHIKKSKPEYDFPEVSEKELQRIKLEIQKKANLEKNLKLKLKLIFIIFILCLFIIFNFF